MSGQAVSFSNFDANKVIVSDVQTGTYGENNNGSYNFISVKYIYNNGKQSALKLKNDVKVREENGKKVRSAKPLRGFVNEYEDKPTVITSVNDWDKYDGEYAAMILLITAVVRSKAPKKGTKSVSNSILPKMSVLKATELEAPRPSDVDDELTEEEIEKGLVGGTHDKDTLNKLNKGCTNRIMKRMLDELKDDLTPENAYNVLRKHAPYGVSWFSNIKNKVYTDTKTGKTIKYPIIKLGKKGINYENLKDMRVIDFFCTLNLSRFTKGGTQSKYMSSNLAHTINVKDFYEMEEEDEFGDMTNPEAVDKFFNKDSEPQGVENMEESSLPQALEEEINYDNNNDEEPMLD